MNTIVKWKLGTDAQVSGLGCGDEDHSQRGFNLHPVFIPTNQLLGAILDCGFRISNLSYRCALSVFIKLIRRRRTLNPNSKFPNPKFIMFHHAQIPANI